MKPYADAPMRRGRQLLSDGVVVLWVVLWVQLGRVVFHAVDRLAAPGRALQSAGGGLSSSLGDAAGRARDLPIVGSSLAGPLDAAGRAAGQVAGAGGAQQSAVAHLALVLGLVAAVLPIVLMLLRWLPQRVSWVRTATAAANSRDQLDEDLMALRALAHRRLCELQRIEPRPGVAYAGGDRTVVARLARLELDALGLSARRHVT